MTRSDVSGGPADVAPRRPAFPAAALDRSLRGAMIAAALTALAAPLVVVAAAHAHSGALDTRWFLLLNGWRGAPDALWATLTIAGLGLSAMLLGTLLLRDRPLALAALPFCVAIGGGLARLVKTTWPVPRPAAVLPPDQIHVIGPWLTRRAMPSGHALAAVTLLVVLWLAGGARWRRPAALAASLVAVAAIALSRVMAGDHWPSDVVAGAALGVLSGCAGVALAGATRLDQLVASRGGRAVIGAVQLGGGLALAATDTGYPGALPFQLLLAIAAVGTGARALLREARGERRAPGTGAGDPAASDPPPAQRMPRVPHRLSVVVPMYDERENVEPLLDAVSAALAAYPFPWELVVVDDGSRDGTGPALRAAAARLGPHVRVVRLLRNFGQSAAMQAGIDVARGDVIVTLDGDLQNDPRDIPRLVARLLEEDLDLVAGWRRHRHDDLVRRIPSVLANRLIRRTTGLAFQDLGCSLKAFRTSALREVRLYGEMHRFIPAWLATVTSPDRMAEEPVAHHGRTRGVSKYGLARTYRVLVDLVAVMFFLKYRARPGHFFGGIGLAVFLAGVAILAYLLGVKLLGQDVGGRPLLSLGFFCIMGGLQFITTGVVAELLIRIWFDGRHPRPYVAAPGAPLADEAGWHGPEVQHA